MFSTDPIGHIVRGGMGAGNCSVQEPYGWHMSTLGLVILSRDLGSLGFLWHLSVLVRVALCINSDVLCNKAWFLIFGVLILD